jgi:undecaprenyl-diphosphatase
MVAGDRGDFRVVNDFARQTGWLHTFFAAVATWGLVLFAVLLLIGWWSAWQHAAAASPEASRRSRRGRTSPAADGAAVRSRRPSPRAQQVCLLWAPLAALVAVAIAQPIAHAVDEQRPFVAMPHVLTLVDHAANAGFPSDHSTAAGALAVGLWLASRRLGVAGAFVAGLIAFSRIYVGVHYPVDVIVGLALGAVVALIGYVLVRGMLGRGLDLISRTPLAVLLAAPGGPASRPDQPNASVAAREQ